MLFRLLADTVVLIHLGFIVFVVIGGFLAWRWRWVAWLHLPTAVWGALIEFMGWICPLTPLEVWLRQRAGQEGYAGGFIEHYLIPAMYPEDWTTALRVVLGTFVVAVNGVAYWGYVRRGTR
jgi:hypothetical protein